MTELVRQDAVAPPMSYAELFQRVRRRLLDDGKLDGFATFFTISVRTSSNKDGPVKTEWGIYHAFTSWNGASPEEAWYKFASAMDAEHATKGLPAVALIDIRPTLDVEGE